MAKRKYTKKAEYWKQFNADNNTSHGGGEVSTAGEKIEPDLLGEPFYTSDASHKETAKARSNFAGGAANRTGTRVNRIAFRQPKDRFASIRLGMLPYDYSSDGVNVRDGIELCQKAYANVAIFRNAIDIMAEFTNTDVYLEGGNKKSREFFSEWFKRINLIDISKLFHIFI